MFQHHLIAALRNMAANKLQSAIAIVGLAIGITAALLMALVIRNQMSFDHFIPGYERTYMVIGGSAAPYGEKTHRFTAAILKSNLLQIESVTRLMLPPRDASSDATLATLKRGQISAGEIIYWADSNVFDVLPLPVFKGDLAKALSRPDGIVLPRAMARKYFGRDDAVGQVIQLNGHPMIVQAVIEDLPANATNLKSGIFASGLASFSPFATDNDGQIAGGWMTSVMTYVRLKPGASLAAVEGQLPKVTEKVRYKNDTGYALILIGLDQLPLYEGLHPGARSGLAVAGMAGLVILLIAAINFVNLLTARAARRGIEVGIRKVCGAAQPTLMLQFLGEAILTVFFATCVGVAFSEWLLPAVNAFLTTGGTLDYGRNPVLLGALLSSVVVLGLLAGAWPAFVLSSFRPSSVLKGVMGHSRGAELVRSALVVLQFAILIGLVVAATVIYQQDAYMTRDALRANIDQVLVVRGTCQPAFRTELRNLPGVAAVSCSTYQLFDGRGTLDQTYKGRSVRLNQIPSFDPGVFALYGVKPLAGSLPPASSAGDYTPEKPRGYILNAAAVKYLGIASPQAAIGQPLQQTVYIGGTAADIIKQADGNGDNALDKQEWDAMSLPWLFPLAADRKLDAGGLEAFLATIPKTFRTPIVAVVPDFSFLAGRNQAVNERIAPTIYMPGITEAGWAAVNIKLKAGQITETLVSIDRLWSRFNPGKPINRYFLDQHMQELYISMLRQAQLFAVFSGIAILLACFGLLGLSVSNTERRTKEIGIRKVMGAHSGAVTSLLLWDFTKPVLWANLFAWPVAYYFLHDWLSGFAYHVALSPLVFVGATLLALIVALLTVAIQSTLVARQNPVLALRYE